MNSFELKERHNSNDTIMTEKHQNTAIDKTVRRNDKIILILLKITIIFGISWLPWNLFNILSDILKQFGFDSNDLNIIFSVCHLLVMSSAISNAIFYGFLHKTIQKEIRRIITYVKRVRGKGGLLPFKTDRLQRFQFKLKSFNFFSTIDFFKKFLKLVLKAIIFGFFHFFLIYFRLSHSF